MGFIRLSIGLEGEKALDRVLGLASEVVGDLTPTFNEVVHPFMLKHMVRQFATEGAHGGSRWRGYGNEPLYARYKMAMVGHNDLLRWDKGGEYEQLYPSLTKQTHPMHIWRSSPTSAAFGTSHSEAKKLSRGGVGPFGERYPGRKVISMRRSQKKTLMTMIQRDIMSRIGADGLRAARIT